MKRARLLRYARYQFRDFAFERALVVLLIASVNSVTPVMMIRDLPPAQRALGPESAMAAMISPMFVALIMLAVLFTSQELISRARKAGYYRLTFAKPVNPVLFYAQLFLIHLVGAVLLISIVTALFSLFAAPLPIGHFALVTAAAFILFGGFGFLVSVFLNHDSIVLILAVGLSILGKAYAAAHTGFGVKLANLLLPVDHLSALVPFLFGGPLSRPDAAWVLGYGLTVFGLGLIALRYRPLAD